MPFQTVMGHKVGPSAVAGDDGTAIGEQFAPVVGNDDAAASQAPTWPGWSATSGLRGDPVPAIPGTEADADTCSLPCKQVPGCER
jgi:hypothetical protein